MSMWAGSDAGGGSRGPLCWAVELSPPIDLPRWNSDRMELDPPSARIESAPAPESPTQAELAAAKAWRDPDESSQ